MPALRCTIDHHPHHNRTQPRYGAFFWGCGKVSELFYLFFYCYSVTYIIST
jgi:hypothetical protein